MISLHDLGRQHGTDKWDINHSFRGESYLHIYEQYLSPMRDEPITFLELGVKRGASVRMWKTIFPKAKSMVSMSILTVPDMQKIGVHVHTLSQDDAAGLTQIAESVGGFDVVLDDCSHINVLTLASLEILLPFVKPGGFYIIEDLGMSWVDYGQVENKDTFMDGELAGNMARGVSATQSRASVNARFEQVIFDMDMLRGDIRFLHFWPNIAIAQKCLTTD